MKKMVEVCGMSVVGIYHDPNVKKLEISGDRYSVETISEATLNSVSMFTHLTQYSECII